MESKNETKEPASSKTKNSESTAKAVTKTVIMGRNRGAVLRLQQDYINLNKDPVPYIRAEPLPWNILEWHYVIIGPENSPYFGGYYHGSLVFTQQYPFKPPSIYMRTPNGRFTTNRRLCLSISDYHPDEWNPLWSVSSILTGLLSFMLEESRALGTIETLRREKLQFARDSLDFNLNDSSFTKLFPDLCKEIKQKLSDRQAAADEARQTAKQRTDLTDDTNLETKSNNNKNSSDNAAMDGGYEHLILIICFCLCALIIHHVYNFQQLQ